MVETSPFKAPPNAPIQVNMEGVTHPAILLGRNTSLAKINARIITGGQD